MLVLFPSYVPFVSEKPYELLKNNSVVTILQIAAQQRFKSQIDFIYYHLNNRNQVLPIIGNEKYTVGEQVVVSNGPFTGLERKILNISSVEKQFNRGVIYGKQSIQY